MLLHSKTIRRAFNPAPKSLLGRYYLGKYSHLPPLSGGHWVTIERDGEWAHVYIGGSGMIIAGPKALEGKNVSNLPKNADSTPAKIHRPKKAPVSEAPKTQAEELPHPTKLHHVKNLGGSTGAALHTDGNGKGFVLKRGASEVHLRNENDADAAYRAAGVPVAKSRLTTDANGKLTKVAEHIPGKTLAQLSPAETAVAHKLVQQHFVTDAVLGNWDAVGLEHDNIIAGDDGKTYRIDNGGSLKYRAQGGLKTPAQFGEEVSELKTMRDAKINPSAAKVFGGVTDDDIRKQSVSLIAKKQQILNAIKDPGTREMVGKRIDWLEKNIVNNPPMAGNTGIASKGVSPTEVHVNAGKDVIEKTGSSSVPAGQPGSSKENPVDITIGDKESFPSIKYSPKKIEEMQNFNGTGKNALTPEQDSAIRSWSGSSYGLIRKVDMGGKLDAYNQGTFTKLHSDLYSALDKLPKFEGTVYRGIKGISDADVAALQHGGTMELGAIASFSRDVGNGADFARTYNGDEVKGNSVLLKLTGASHEIAHVSNFGESESETLFPKGAKFKITKTYWGKDKEGLNALIVEGKQV